LLNSVDESVGLITITTRDDDDVIKENATGFLVGEGYLMTAYNVFSDKIGNIL